MSHVIKEVREMDQFEKLEVYMDYYIECLAYKYTKNINFTKYIPYEVFIKTTIFSWYDKRKFKRSFSFNTYKPLIILTSTPNPKSSSWLMEFYNGSSIKCPDNLEAGIGLSGTPYWRAAPRLNEFGLSIKSSEMEEALKRVNKAFEISQKFPPNIKKEIED